ncbi:MAG: hypothetical protein H5T84_10930, partial [Thermoleophilia bacterium]|nr:hypothetical protein [Thermoleophilia bacterium]
PALVRALGGAGADANREQELGDPAEKLAQRLAQAFAAAPSLVVTDTRGGKTREVDVKTYVDGVDLSVGEEGTLLLSYYSKVTSTGSVRPERMVAVLGQLADCKLELLRAVRTKIHVDEV